MPVATLSEVLRLARVGEFGVPNLWGGSIEKILGHIAAAEELQTPISICYNRALCPEISLEYGFEIILAAARKSSTPIAVILDHGDSPEECAAAIRAGASGVMYDGSHLSFRENIAKTREVVRTAHAANVSVEAEIGKVGGSALEYGGDGEIDSTLTDPDEAEKFVKQTGVDALAISVGNSHGSYKGTPNIRHELIRDIRSRVDIPLVLHGASGLPEGEYLKIVNSGISKINYYTGMSTAAMARLVTFVNTDPGTIGCHNVIRHMIEVYKDETLRLLRLCGVKIGGNPGWENDEIDVKKIAEIVIQVLRDRRQNGRNE